MAKKKAVKKAAVKKAAPVKKQEKISVELSRNAHWTLKREPTTDTTLGDLLSDLKELTKVTKGLIAEHGTEKLVSEFSFWDQG